VPSRNLYWFPTLVFLLVGVVYLYASLTMEEAWSGGYQHRLVPLAMSVAVVVLCGMLLFTQRNCAAKKEDGGYELTGSEPLLAGELFLKSLPLIALMVLYALAQSWFGYLLASLLCGVAVFKLFGNSLLVSAGHSIVISAVIYLLFFKLLKLYDPPGRLIDLSSLL